MPHYASVYILDVPFALDRAYEYFIPEEFSGRVKAGSFITVPFGGGNKKMLALVTRISDTCIYDEASIKPVAAVCSDELFMEEKLVGLALFLKEQTLCTMGEAVHAMIPSAAFSHLVEYYSAGEKSGTPRAKDKTVLEILEFIRGKKSVSEANLKANFGASSKEAAAKLSSEGYITREIVLKDASNKIIRKKYSLRADENAVRTALSSDGKGRLTSAGQRKALEVLAKSDTLYEDEILSEDVTKAHLSALVKRGLAVLEEEQVYRNPYEGKKAEQKEIKLNDEQKFAYDKLCGLLGTGEARAALLYGVTGSGKTSVMTVLMDKVLEEGKSVILLLPEISLTPQTTDIFCSRYGSVCAVVHSGLSAGERYDAYERIKNGDARIVIGTRSAVFSPVKNLGLIVMDEEQETTYKSDQNPKYHARDAARYRCATENALMLLASATPSLESFEKAKEGKYSLVRLEKRYGGATLPTVTIADMRGEVYEGNVSPIGGILTTALAENVAKGKQSVLFINRRGYNTFVSCRKCGEAVMCPRCSVSMTYHTKMGTYSDGYLACHWCGYRTDVPKTCPSCGSEHLSHMGYGTQRIEQELGELLPNARVLRMDTDSTSTKFSYDKMLGSFRAGDADILLGTQMVTKGHDFPRVTLVGVLLADASLYLDDYRAGERTFSMLTQVIGRAGRTSENGAGRAVIQTNNPDNDVIKLAAAQDYDTFFEREIKLRKLLVFPPFCDIVLMTISSEDERELATAAKKLHDEFEVLTSADGEFPDVKSVCFGPFEAPVYKVDGRCRMRMVVKCRLNRRSRGLFAKILRIFSGEKAAGKGRNSKKPFLSIDFNPSVL